MASSRESALRCGLCARLELTTFCTPLRRTWTSRRQACRTARSSSAAAARELVWNYRCVTPPVTYILVLQWPASSLADYDQLVAIEGKLHAAMGGDAAVDGHDMGSGEMNVFIATDQPTATFNDVRSCLAEDPLWSDVRAAYRAADEDEYTVLWPPGQHAFTVA